MKKIIGLCLITMFLSACGFEIVDTGHRGVETRYGKVVSESLPEGLYFYNPITSDMKEMDVRVKKYENETSTYTKDVQVAKVRYVVNYNLNQEKAHIVFAEVGPGYGEILIPQAVEGALKASIGKWDAVNLISNREEARLATEAVLRTSLGSKNINVTRFELKNVTYQPEFEDAVEKKVIAIQKADEAINNTVRIEEEAKQKVIAAKGEAQAIKVRAAAIAENPALVKYEAVLKWDGVLPKFTGGGPVPFIDVGN